MGFLDDLVGKVKEASGGTGGEHSALRGGRSPSPGCCSKG